LQVTSTNAILYGTNICLQDAIILVAADWFAQGDIIHTHC